MTKISLGIDLQERFTKSFPAGTFIDSNNMFAVESYLKSEEFIPSEQKVISLEKPGEGNMNLVLRVQLDTGKTLIVKQARPWVEKFPEFDAPVIRSRVEREFLGLMRSYPELRESTASILGFDEKSHVIILEDLGEAADFTFVYKNGAGFNKNQIDQIADFSNALNNLTGINNFPANMEMRRLNHEHIFHLPFISMNGFQLDGIQPGLKEISRIITSDRELYKKVSDYGNVYLQKGSHLQHGDLYPGSILNSEPKIRVIDPEFAFMGPREWDVSIFIAHLFLSKADHEIIEYATERFEKKGDFNEPRFRAFIGIEIIRRLIGIAQLPLEMTLEEKEELLRNASRFIKSGILGI